MFCSRSLSIHLLRGLGGAVLIVLALMSGSERVWLLLPLLIGALLLLRGCPMCWLMGLIGTASLRRRGTSAVD